MHDLYPFHVQTSALQREHLAAQAHYNDLMESLMARYRKELGAEGVLSHAYPPSADVASMMKLDAAVLSGERRNPVP